MTLNRRQRRCLAPALRGLSRKEIAAEVGIHPQSVANALTGVYRHFGVHGQAELLARLGSRYPGMVGRSPPDEPILYG